MVFIYVKVMVSDIMEMRFGVGGKRIVSKQVMLTGQWL